MTHWLLTNTTYGTWLPGDPRGSVTSVRDRRPDDPPSARRVEHSTYGEPCEPSRLGLFRSAQAKLKSSPQFLTKDHAEILLPQFRETANFRSWTLLAIAVMANHFHLVVAADGNVDPRKMLVDFKAYGTRVLNRRFGQPPAETWWTSGGSKRKLTDDRAVQAAVNYVLHKQTRPLIVWSPNDQV